LDEKKFKTIDNFSKQRLPRKTCWEIANELGDFRSAFNICEDCIVFILRSETIILSEKEVLSLEGREISCSFFNT